jgi:hypothetical protein
MYKIHWILVFHVWKEIQNKEEEEGDSVLLMEMVHDRCSTLLEMVHDRCSTLLEMVHDRCSTLLTEFGTALTTILPILFQYCFQYCYSDSQNL